MIVQLKNVKKHYEQFDLDCSLEVKEGYITGIIGQNGAGKSTTFKAILGLISIDSGEIKLLGKDYKEITADDKKNIGVVLSDSGFNDFLNIKEISKIIEQMYNKFNKNEFINKCKQFNLPLDKELKSFSTGMKAKLKLLVAISYGAKLLILDEPTVGLDVVARDELLELLRSYMETKNNSILISSHISSDLEGLCDDIYMIDKGKIILHEETDILLSEYGLIKVDENQFSKLDKKYIIKVRKESFGYSCLTKEKQFYLDNYPNIVIEKGNIDEVITMVIKGENNL